MEADPQAWQPPPGALDCVGRRRRPDHQAGAGQDAVAMRPLDGLVDGNITAEIVGADDQAAGGQPQPAISR